LKPFSFNGENTLRLLRICIISIAFTSQSGYAQFDLVQKFLEPNIFKVTEELREYIRNDLPKVSHNRDEELRHIDLIFAKAMELSNNDLGTGLLAISLAVLNRTSFEPTFPLIGRVKLPLPSEDSVNARYRMDKLPRYFFKDSPQDKWGDSAKLVHFFGSAYLTYETGTKKIPDAIGVWIEEGEKTFKLDSLGQKRDVFINRLGQQFANALTDGREVLPSDFLRAEFIQK
jgi:hypothetical protein